MSSFINFNNKNDSAINLYSAEVIKEALLISETKSPIKATKIVEDIKEPVALNEALNLFTDKLTAVKSLSSAIIIVNEGRVKQFEMDFKDMVNDIKKGYGWIDPEYVAQTWDNSSDSIDFSLVRDEIFDRLIDAGLLAHPDSSNPEKAGKKLKSAKELYAFENNETTLEEGKSITKIQKEYGQVVKDMVTTVEEWKTAEGDRKAELLEKLRALTAQKKDLLAQLDDAVGLKDVHAELAESVVTEALSKEQKMVETFLNKIAKEFDYSIQDAVRFVKETISKMGLDESIVTEKKEEKDEAAEIEAEIEKLTKENKHGYAKDIKRLKVRLSAVNMMKKFNKNNESEVTEHHSENPNDKYEVRHCDKPETPYGVWEGDTLVKCFELEEDAFAFAKEQNKEQGLSENRELMAIDSYLNTKDEEVLIDFLDDAYGNSDDRKTRKEWEGARNDLGYNELIDYAVAHAENFGMDLQDIEDAIEVYEAKTINEKDDAGTHLDNLADLVGNAKSFMNVGKELKAGNYKYDFSTGMMPMYMIHADGFKFAILNKKYVDGGDREVGDIAIGLMESVNERSYGQNSDDALILIQQALKGMKNMKAEIKGDTVIISNKAKDEFTYSLNDGGDVQEFIDELEESVVEVTLDSLVEKFALDTEVNEDIRGDVKKFIRDNKEVLNDLADQDLWDEMYQKLYDEFGVDADSIKAKDLLKTFQFVF